MSFTHPYWRKNESLDLEDPYQTTLLGWDYLDPEGFALGYTVRCVGDQFVPLYRDTFLTQGPMADRYEAARVCEKHYRQLSVQLDEIVELGAQAWRQGIKGETSLEIYPGHVPVEALGDVGHVTCHEHLVVQTPWEPNVIADTIATLLGALFRGETGYDGIQYVVVGSGEADWDSNGVPAASASQTQMVNELDRVAATVTYLTSANAVSSTPTSRLAISGIFTATDGNGDWREWGLVGGNATTQADTGLLIDYRTHGIVTKTAADTFVRRVRLSF